MLSLRNEILRKADEAILHKAAYLLFVPKKKDIITDRGVTFHLRYYNTELLSKISSPPQKFRKDPLLPPFDPNIHICDMKDGAYHHILVNKFMQKRGHIVVSSINPSAEQGEPLNDEDFTAFSKVLLAFGCNGICYYNSGIESGCTQLHKHVQFVPTSEKPLFDAMVSGENLPFIYHAVKLRGSDASAIADAYKELMDMAKRDPAHPAYNFIVSDGNAVFVPRRKARHECGLVVNSIGICGHLSIWQWTHPMVRREPLTVIRDLCVPK